MIVIFKLSTGVRSFYLWTWTRGRPRRAHSSIAKKNLNAIFSSLHCWTGAHSSGLKASRPVRKVFLSSGASGQNERWSLEVWDEGVLLYGSLAVTALGAPFLAAAGSAPQNHPAQGWGFHSSSGVFGTETLSGKNKVPVVLFSLSLCPINQDSYSANWGLVVQLSHVRNVLSNCQCLGASTAEPAVLSLCQLPGETNSKPLCTELQVLSSSTCMHIYNLLPSCIWK